MITPAQAEKLMANHQLELQTEIILLEEALHRVLAEDLIADSDLPPFNRVMMDGIAINFRSLELGHRSFRIQAMQRAGEAPITLENENECIEIMTGAVCSIGCDTVIPYEHLRISQGIAHIEILPEAAGKNVHMQGRDKRKGDTLVTSGSIIQAPEIGIAASVGKHMLTIKRLPRVLICSTGDELVEIDETPLAYQIRRSNAYALSAMMQILGIHAVNSHLPDEIDSLRESISYGLNTYDVVILSGGVSKGKFDLLPKILNDLKVDTVFHGIAQRPGKPMWFGKTSKTTVFALPGNPVSTLACAARYVLPWLRNQMGQPSSELWVSPENTPTAHEKMSLFLPAKLSYSTGKIMAAALQNQGSGDFSALVGADGFMEVNPGVSNNDYLRFYPLK